MKDMNKEFRGFEKIKEEVKSNIEKNHKELNEVIKNMYATDQNVQKAITKNQADLDQISNDLDDLLNSL